MLFQVIDRLNELHWRSQPLTRSVLFEGVDLPYGTINKLYYGQRGANLSSAGKVIEFLVGYYGKGGDLEKQEQLSGKILQIWLSYLEE